MPIIHTDKIKDNMILSEDVKDINGRILLKKSLQMNSSHIRILKMWGITEVSIAEEEGIKENTESAADQEHLEKIREEVKQDFRHVDLDHPAARELFRLAVQFRCEKGSPHKNNIPQGIELNGSPGLIKPDIQKKIMLQDVKLPEIPSIIFELNDIMADPMASADDIARIVSKSPSLATVLLKIVNSAFYGFPSKIDNITRAVTIIGTREIGSLALGISVITIFEGIPETLMNMFAFMRHGFACGIISRILTAQKNMPQTEQLFVSGLLHDIGRAIIYKYFPDHAGLLLNRSFKSGKLLYQEEGDCLGCSHTDIGMMLLKKWKLPFNLESNISFHHNPSSAPSPTHAGIVHLADIITNALGLGSSGERLVPPLDSIAWNNLGISTSCFDVVIRQAVNQLSAFDSFLKQ
ncbi:putative signal transduction protein [uncultured Desulfobacterium sp.]|uniref:Putative signal transduction protein n=1 Tax=uncultured Desulfobacterium sp. TaxID=201089 RepID=A0A445N2R7_9BACT|nr:putative signal transduction protein [uncultured Desulfobacterium sp.]